MAPEQIDGRPLGLTTDLFAASVVFWELLAGKRLFVRDNPAATLLAVTATIVPRITTIRSDIAPAWDAFFTRSLARDGGDRFQSAAETLDALDAIADAKSDDAAALLGELVVRFAADPAPIRRPRWTRRRCAKSASRAETALIMCCTPRPRRVRRLTVHHEFRKKAVSCVWRDLCCESAT